jgi:copper chaperone
MVSYCGGGALGVPTIPEMAMIEFTLPTMTCGHCVRTVTETVKRVDQAATLQVDLPTHKVKIESSQSAQQFAAALSEEGYAPSE